MFQRCRKLKHITLPDGLEMIGEYYFQESGLTELTIPNSVTKIERLAFSMCLELKKVVLTEGLETISEACFWKNGLEEVEVPKSVKTI